MDTVRVLLDPSRGIGALVYAAVFLAAASLAAQAIRVATRRFLARLTDRQVDITGMQFLSQLARLLVFLVAIVLYAHVVPGLRSVGTALLAGASVASIVVGLAAQSTLGNLVAGFAILLYHPIRLGDRITCAGPAGPVTGVVDALTLGYTVVRTDAGARLIMPNSLIASQPVLNVSTAPRTGSS